MAVNATTRPQWRIAVLGPIDGREDVVRELEPSAALEWYQRPDALVDHVPIRPMDAVILGLQDETGSSIVATVVEIAARRPSLPVVIYDRIDGATLRSVLAIFGVGLRMECAPRPHEGLATVLRRVTSPNYRPSVVPLLLYHFVGPAPKPLQLFLALAALSVPERRGVDEISRWCGVSLRTIERRLASARWPTARVVLHSFIALDAVWLMSEYGWSARRVHTVRGFAHASSVTRLLARYVGLRPSSLREDGGFPAALEYVTRALSPR
jgi:hypothetical protein